eukprot:2072475-Prymnesium_polylepis.2
MQRSTPASLANARLPERRATGLGMEFMLLRKGDTARIQRSHTRASAGPRTEPHAARHATQHARLARHGAAHQRTASQPESCMPRGGAAKRILEAGWRTGRRRRSKARGAGQAAYDGATPPPPSPAAPTAPSNTRSERPQGRNHTPSKQTAGRGLIKRATQRSPPATATARRTTWTGNRSGAGEGAGLNQDAGPRPALSETGLAARPVLPTPSAARPPASRRSCTTSVRSPLSDA